MSAHLPLLNTFHSKVHHWLEAVTHDPLDDEAFPLLPLEESGPSELPVVSATVTKTARERKRSAVNKFFTEVQL